MTATVSREANTLTVTIPSSEGFVCIGVPPPPEDFDLALAIVGAVAIAKGGLRRGA